MQNQLTERDNVSTESNTESKVAWQRPTIGRIDIRRTMGGSGPNPDFPSGTSIF